ncbi:MAG: hypothetical protein LBJ31_01560 [Treponema sp.]|nr:hypothetical protein [Treponema sp.]
MDEKNREILFLLTSCILSFICGFFTPFFYHLLFAVIPLGIGLNISRKYLFSFLASPTTQAKS